MFSLLVSLVRGTARGPSPTWTKSYMVSNTTYAAPAGRDSEMESLWSYRGDHNLTDCGTEIYNLI